MGFAEVADACCDAFFGLSFAVSSGLVMMPAQERRNAQWLRQNLAPISFVLFACPPGYRESLGHLPSFLRFAGLPSLILFLSQLSMVRWPSVSFSCEPEKYGLSVFLSKL